MSTLHRVGFSRDPPMRLLAISATAGTKVSSVDRSVWRDTGCDRGFGLTVDPCPPPVMRMAPAPLLGLLATVLRKSFEPNPLSF